LLGEVFHVPIRTDATPVLRPLKTHERLRDQRDRRRGVVNSPRNKTANQILEAIATYCNPPNELRS
jgi:hypothetical protein